MTANNGNGRKPRLELTWIGKEERPRLEPRILVEQPELSYAKAGPDDAGIRDNTLIQGDNLLALKALEQQYSGKVKCVFIDPPYNTGAVFGAQYDDGVEHSRWLTLLRDRLEVLHRLLTDDGSLWITIDDNECHYLKVLCDELFGRSNFIANVIWQKIYTVKNSARHFSDMHDHVLVYAKDIDVWHRNLLPRSGELDATYLNPDNDPRGPWTTNAVQARNYYSLGSYEITSPNGMTFRPPAGTYWRISKETFLELDRDNRIWWGRDGNATPRIKRFLSEAKQGVVPATLWFHEDAGHNAEAKEEVRKLVADTGEEVFLTPKPERLLKRLLEIATNPGDLVLDSFAGSGTTGAVAHKMGRRWIMVELGDHATTHIVPRLKKVIDGKDPGGVTEMTGWPGGGGFRFCRLAPSLIETDQFGQRVISKQYKPEMLVEAMCKHMGYTYVPVQDRQLFWQQGYSTERDFVYVTTQSLTHDALSALSLDVGPDRTLLICCKAFRARVADFPNLTVKKIPQAVLDNCEWGRDDYSLNIATPTADTADEPDDGPDDAGSANQTPRPRTRSSGNTEVVARNGASLHSAAPKNPPLRMDGTVRPSRAAKPPALPAATKPPTPVNSTRASTRKSSKNKPAPQGKQSAPVKKKGAAKSPKSAKPKTPAATKRKPRPVADHRQGSLL